MWQLLNYDDALFSTIIIQLINPQGALSPEELLETAWKDCFAGIDFIKTGAQAEAVCFGIKKILLRMSHA